MQWLNLGVTHVVVLFMNCRVLHIASAEAIFPVQKKRKGKSMPLCFMTEASVPEAAQDSCLQYTLMVLSMSFHWRGLVCRP